MRRVLFVDDEPGALEALQRTLRSQYEWEVAVARSGEAALALLEASAFEVVVSDMRMPGMDGPTLLAHVRERHPDLVRIVLSAPAELQAALRAVPVAHQFLTKPCDANTLRVAVERACRLKALLSDNSIRGMIGAMGDLPALPRVYQALTQALANPNVSLGRVATLVEQDVAISAKILQLVNSAFFGLAQPMTSLRAAVSYLGLDTLKNLVLSVEVFHSFKSQVRVPGFSLEALQQHAQLAARITSQLPVPKHLAEAAVLAALLHDVGKLILAWKLPDRFGAALHAAQSEAYPLFEVEEQLYGYSHAEIGAYLLGLWGLPNTIVEAVAHHHTPTRIPYQRFDAVAAVYLANLLAHEIESGEAAQHGAHLPIDEEYLEDLGVAEMLPPWRAAVAELATAAPAA
jgi:HD-like signal output (HDOD) protein